MKIVYFFICFSFFLFMHRVIQKLEFGKAWPLNLVHASVAGGTKGLRCRSCQNPLSNHGVSPLLAFSLNLRPWAPQFYAIQRGSLYPLYCLGSRPSSTPYWLKKPRWELTTRSRVIPLGFIEASFSLRPNPTHMIPAARKVLEMPWDYVLLGEALRLAIKFGRPFNVVFDPIQCKKRIEDTAVFLKPELAPGQIPFPGMLLGLRLDF